MSPTDDVTRGSPVRRAMQTLGALNVERRRGEWALAALASTKTSWPRLRRSSRGDTIRHWHASPSHRPGAIVLMPIYEYLCESTGHRFEVRQSFSDDALTECTECGAPVRRVLHPAGVIFKGSGWYINDS